MGSVKVLVMSLVMVSVTSSHHSDQMNQGLKYQKSQFASKVKTKMLSNEIPSKNYFWPFQHCWPCRGSLWAIGAERQPANWQNGQLSENRRYPKLTQQMGKIYIWVQRKKKQFVLAKNGPWHPPQSPQCNAVNTNKLFVWCPVIVVTKFLNDVLKKYSKYQY